MAIVVAETEVEKAIDILKVALARPHDEYEDLGRVTDTLLKALRLQPGQLPAHDTRKQSQKAEGRPKAAARSAHQ